MTAVPARIPRIVRVPTYAETTPFGATEPTYVRGPDAIQVVHDIRCEYCKRRNNGKRDTCEGCGATL